MKERTVLRREARRRTLLDGALAVFSERGFRGTSMNDVAQEVGVSKALLYHYFASKQEVLVELYEEVLRENVLEVRRVAESERSSVEALAEIIRQRVAYTCHNQALLRVFFEEEAELPQRQRARLIVVRREYEQTIIDLIGRGQTSGELYLRTSPQVVVNTILGAANWVYKWYNKSGSLNPDQLGNEIADVLLFGLRAERPVSALSGAGDDRPSGAGFGLLA